MGRRDRSKEGTNDAVSPVVEFINHRTKGGIVREELRLLPGFSFVTRDWLLQEMNCCESRFLCRDTFRSRSNFHFCPNLLPLEALTFNDPESLSEVGAASRAAPVAQARDFRGRTRRVKRVRLGSPDRHV